MKKICVLKSSPRKEGNTYSLLKVVTEELRRNDCQVVEFDLYDMNINSCVACRECQKDWSKVYCVQNDDFKQVADAVLDSDLILLASPIYSWYCTPPLKATLDRLVYAMNMYYGDECGPSLWKGKELAIVTTCGYPVHKGADLFEEGMKRYSKHSGLNYVGMLCERHLSYKEKFVNEEKEARAIEFANKLG
ncbi:MAG: flavodoxin family protein [Firmicutes bacterium]|nr:flavodoxin family protein [Bacillota bacterium]